MTDLSTYMMLCMKSDKLESACWRLQAEKDQWLAEQARLMRQIELMHEAEYKFCPDCRDKVKNQPCLRCQLQTMTALKGKYFDKTLRLRATLERIATDNDCDPRAEARNALEGKDDE